MTIGLDSTELHLEGFDLVEEGERASRCYQGSEARVETGRGGVRESW